jgi:ABC-type polysaccharide/polyol phosphate transport system ATPase subunit
MPSSPEPAPASAPARVPAIECRHVVKRFYHYEHRTTSLREVFIRSVLRRPIHVRRAHFMLRDFSLAVYPGESVALLGSNGSGKSTALRLLAGIYTPTEGTIATRGRVAAVIELGVGFNTELTGAENVRLHAAVMGLSRREIAERFADIVAFADVGDFIDEPVKYYSSGMHARLAFATSVASRPDVLLLDEVLAVGDQWFRERCYAWLHDFRAGGGTLVVVSHDMEAVRALCDRAVWLERGRTRLAGETAEVIAAYHAARAAAPLAEG